MEMAILLETLNVVHLSVGIFDFRCYGQHVDFILWFFHCQEHCFAVLNSCNWLHLPVNQFMSETKLQLTAVFCFLRRGIASYIFSSVLSLPLQMITLPAEESLDLVRTLRMASYGMLFSGPSLHYWFNFISKVVPKKDVVSTFKKMFLGQAVYGPIINCIFFSYNAGLQGIILICFSIRHIYIVLNLLCTSVLLLMRFLFFPHLLDLILFLLVLGLASMTPSL